MKNSVEKYFKKGIDAFLPHISINCVVFAFDGEELLVLAQRFIKTDIWVLPGGHILKDENLDEGAYRNLKLSGIDNVFLRQFRTFGEKNRLVNRPSLDATINNLPKEILDWVTQRFISVGYYALTNFKKTHLKPGLFSSESKWMNLKDMNLLVLDHSEIVKEARKVLSEDILSFPVIANLISDTFTIPELRRLYESILDRPIDRGTFRRKLMNSNILEKVGKQDKPVRRPATIYKLNQENYIRSLMEETKFGF